MRFRHTAPDRGSVTRSAPDREIRRRSQIRAPYWSAAPKLLKPNPMQTRRNSGLTIVEVLLIMVALGVLAAFILPLFARAKERRGGPSCLSNLKQVGLAFRMWAYDHGQRFPMELLSLEGGTRETLFQGPFGSFNIISNELNNPKPLTCPRDEDRTRATVWSQLGPKNLRACLKKHGRVRIMQGGGVECGSLPNESTTEHWLRFVHSHAPGGGAA